MLSAGIPLAFLFLLQMALVHGTDQQGRLLQWSVQKRVYPNHSEVRTVNEGMSDHKINLCSWIDSCDMHTCHTYLPAHIYIHAACAETENHT